MYLASEEGEGLGAGWHLYLSQLARTLRKLAESGRAVQCSWKSHAAEALQWKRGRIGKRKTYSQDVGSKGCLVPCNSNKRGNSVQVPLALQV